MTAQKKSRFSDLLERESEQEEEYLQPESEVMPPTPLPTPDTPKRGRPTIGKRSDPSYKQATIFIRKDQRRQIERILLDREGQELSDVIEDALSDWLVKNS
jgi:hypothetical protein